MSAPGMLKAGTIQNLISVFSLQSSFKELNVNLILPGKIYELDPT